MGLCKVVDRVDRAFVSSLSREELEKAFMTLYNDNLMFRQKTDEQARLLALVEEMRRLAAARPYIPSTEAMQYLFDELEVTFTYERKAEEEEEEGGRRRKAPRGPSCRLSASTPVRVVDHTESAPETIVRDGAEYRRSGSEAIVKLAIVPARKYIEKHIYASYSPVHEPEKGERRKVVLFRSPLDPTGATASAVASIAVSKYDDHLPLYRQAEIFGRDGLGLSRQTICRWLMKGHEALLEFGRFIERRMLRMDFIHQDETPLEVLDVRSPSGRASTSSFVIIRAGCCLDGRGRKVHSLISMTYTDSRRIGSLLEGIGGSSYAGGLMSDGLKGYLHFPAGRHCVCWVHAVRRFKDILKASRGNAVAFRVCSKASELYAIEKVLRGRLEDGSITREEFLSQRREQAGKVIEEFFGICDEEGAKVAPGSPLGKAFGYVQEYRKLLPNYLEYAESTPDNNRCERIAKAFATSRKNFLFSKSVDGADASCLYFSLIESAKEAGLNPELYLEHVLERAPLCKGDDEYEKLLPWNCDLSGEEARRKEAATLSPDPARTEEYRIAGFSR